METRTATRSWVAVQGLGGTKVLGVIIMRLVSPGWPETMCRAYGPKPTMYGSKDRFPGQILALTELRPTLMDI